MSMKKVFVALGLCTLTLTGCLSPVRQEVDALVCKSAAMPVDLLPPRPDLPASEMSKLDSRGGIQLVGGKDDKPGPKKGFAERLEPGTLLPGAEIRWPANFAKLSAKEQEAVLAKYFPPQLPMGPDPQPVPGPDGRP